MKAKCWHKLVTLHATQAHAPLLHHPSSHRSFPCRRRGRFLQQRRGVCAHRGRQQVRLQLCTHPARSSIPALCYRMVHTLCSGNPGCCRACFLPLTGRWRAPRSPAPSASALPSSLRRRRRPRHAAIPSPCATRCRWGHVPWGLLGGWERDWLLPGLGFGLSEPCCTWCCGAAMPICDSLSYLPTSAPLIHLQSLRLGGLGSLTGASSAESTPLGTSRSPSAPTGFATMLRSGSGVSDCHTADVGLVALQLRAACFKQVRAAAEYRFAVVCRRGREAERARWMVLCHYC